MMERTSLFFLGRVGSLWQMEVEDPVSQRKKGMEENEERRKVLVISARHV
jgi:hypothetical protein